MKTKLFCLLLGATLLLAQAPMALAQAQTSLHDWSVVKAVGVDERLIVKQKDGTTIEAKMIEATDTNLSLSRKGKVVNISRDNIQQIEHWKGKRRRASGRRLVPASALASAAALAWRRTIRSLTTANSTSWLAL